MDISQERADDFYEDEEDEEDLEDEDGLVPSASALVSKDDFRQRLALIHIYYFLTHLDQFIQLSWVPLLSIFLVQTGKFTDIFSLTIFML